MRCLALLLLVALAAPVAALDFTPRRDHHFALFEPALETQEPAPGAGPEPRAEPAPGDSGGPAAGHWAGRGVSLSLVYTGAVALPAAGIGFELGVPVDPYVSITIRGGVIGGVFFEGMYADVGVRMFLDTGRAFTLYATLGYRFVAGRVLDYIGGNLEDPLYRVGFGGFHDLGFETGTRRVRFFLEVTLNGAKLFNTDFQIAFFSGVNFGLRIYIF